MLWRLWSLTGCAVGVGPTRNPRRQPAADLPVLSADSVSQGPPIQKAIWVNLCKHTRRRSWKKCLDTHWAVYQQPNNYWKCVFQGWNYMIIQYMWLPFRESSMHRELSRFQWLVFVCVQIHDVLYPTRPCTRPHSRSWLSLSRNHKNNTASSGKAYRHLWKA